MNFYINIVSKAVAPNRNARTELGKEFTFVKTDLNNHNRKHIVTVECTVLYRCMQK